MGNRMQRELKRRGGGKLGETASERGALFEKQNRRKMRDSLTQHQRKERVKKNRWESGKRDEKKGQKKIRTRRGLRLKEKKKKG